MAERITSLTAPPIVGRYYAVPTVAYPWLRLSARPFPVFLPKHEDGKHLHFPHQHYHIDPRFLTAAEFSAAGRYSPLYDAWQVLQGYPLLNSNWAEHPPIVWLRRRCRVADIPYRAPDVPQRLAPVFAGAQCKRARTGWVCPHKHVPLGQFAAVDGVITCPLHGLQISAATGVVVGPLPLSVTTS